MSTSEALSAVEVRGDLVRALALDLIGPGPDDTAHAFEVLPQAPPALGQQTVRAR